MILSEAEISEKWQSLVNIQSLCEILNSKLKRSRVRGIDRLNIYQFLRQADHHLPNIARKCGDGTYRFSPYSENLQSKGKGKSPRVIGVPTVRDKIVLYALKELLMYVFPECVPRKLSNTHIHEIKKLTNSFDLQSTLVLRTDIKNFYPSVKREILLEKLSQRISHSLIINLIKQAIETPVVPRNYRRIDKKDYKESQGIPQGLSISNILAAIYINNIDVIFKEKIDNIHYFRYVDDILIFYPQDHKIDIYDRLKQECEQLGLDIHEIEDGKKGKTFQGSALEQFDYLGYSFTLPNISIKQSSVDRFIDSIVAHFSKYHSYKAKMLKQYRYLTLLKIKQIFLIELNEMITGAISQNRRYGWIFYYNAVSDNSIFYQIDKIIEKLFARLEDFDKQAPPELKKLSKAYHEGKYNLRGGYIHNYNNYQDFREKMNFLNEKGKIDPEKGYSEEEINEMYEFEKNRNLARLEKDNAIIY